MKVSTPSGMIGVVMPCRDRHDEYRQALESVLGQSWTNWEVLVVDDGSNPALKLPSPLHPRVRLMRLPGLGVQQARNRGYFAIKRLRTRWVLFSDGDKVWESDAFARMVVSLETARKADSTIAYAYGAFERGGMASFCPPEWSADHLKRLPYVDSASLIDASCLDGLDPVWVLDESRLQDWSLWLRLLQRGFRGVRVPGGSLFSTQYPEGCISMRGGVDYRYWNQRIRDRYCGDGANGAVS